MPYRKNIIRLLATNSEPATGNIEDVIIRAFLEKSFFSDLESKLGHPVIWHIFSVEMKNN